MDKAYADTVRLLLDVAPDVFAGGVFALKGGTAINLFVRDMPRLSVDLDLVYTPWQTPRQEALSEIAVELAAIAERLKRRGLQVRTIAGEGVGDSKLIIDSDTNQVKVEVNPVFRGTVLPVAQQPLTKRTADMFATSLVLPVLAADELYGGKLIAALDRQHPRDLFDVQQMYETDGLTDGAVECAVTYLAGHNRPTHEVLFATPKDIEREYRATFIGMTTEPASLESLYAARTRLFAELPRRLTNVQSRFLTGLADAQPDWTLLRCPHAESLPALRWKLANLEVFRQRQPKRFQEQAQTLKDKLASVST